MKKCPIKICRLKEMPICKKDKYKKCFIYKNIKGYEGKIK